MSLKLRLLLGFSGLMGIILVSAMGATLGFRELSSAVTEVLDEHYVGVQAATDMLASVERQDSACLSLLLRDEPSPRQTIRAEERSFREALALARSSASVDPVLADTLAGSFEAYSRERDALLAARQVDTLQGDGLAAYRDQVAPRFAAVRHQLFELIRLEHGAMLAADRRARRYAQVRAALYAALVGVSLLGVGFLWKMMRSQLLDRLAELEEVATAIASGKTWRRAPVVAADELGAVATALNRALDSEEALRASSRGDVAMRRSALVAVAALLAPEAIILAPSGAVLVGSGPVADAAAAAWQKRSGPLHADTADTTLDVVGHGLWSAQALRTGANGLVGWLLRREGGGREAGSQGTS
jgi:HAMP domain-containing protein